MLGKHCQVSRAKSADLQGRVAYARAWYAHKNAKGKWCFGPSKFIGYKGLTGDQYVENTYKNDGRRTEAQLQQWFEIVDDDDPLFNELSGELFSLLSKYGKTPSTRMRINIIKNYQTASTDSEHAKLLDLLIAVADTLPPLYRKKLREHLSR
jgi:hypothetical protein